MTQLAFPGGPPCPATIASPRTTRTVSLSRRPDVYRPSATPPRPPPVPRRPATGRPCRHFGGVVPGGPDHQHPDARHDVPLAVLVIRDRKSTRLNSSHLGSSYAGF